MLLAGRASGCVRAELSPGRWVGRNQEGKVWGCEGGAQPGPAIRPGFCMLPSRPPGRGEFHNHGGRQRRLGAKNPGSGNFGQRMRARGAPSQTHTHTHIFPRDLESHPKPPQVQVRDSALPPPRPPTPRCSAGLLGCPPRLAPCPGAAFHPPGLPFAARSRRSERESQPASQPARGGCHPTPAARAAGGTEGWHPGAGWRVAPPWRGECPARSSGEGRATPAGGSLIPTEGAAG